MRSVDVRVAIIGAGFSGIGMAIRLKQAGIHDFVLLERADDVGGAWRDNSYPGCACDVPSHLYSFSFELNPDWSETFSPQNEIYEYLRRCVDRYKLQGRIRFGSEMLNAAWDEETRRWRIETPRGEVTAEVVVQGTGPFSEPAVPKLPGIERFAGTAFHSAQWDHGHNLSGESVAVIGTGASSIQIVPSIQPQVGRLYVFQRTPPWIMPRARRRISSLERWLYRRLPAARRLARTCLYAGRELITIGLLWPWVMRFVEPLALGWLRIQVRDPELREKLRPQYRMGCKRMLLSNDYYPSLTAPNVEVVVDGIREIRERSIVSADGSEREIDTIVFSTGFHLTDPSIGERVRGRGGTRLADVWRQGGMRALRGTTVPQFPNYFMLGGPNTGIGNTSLLFMIESQIAYVLDCLRIMDARGVAIVEAREEAEVAFNRRIQERLERTVWASGCVSHYLDANGRNTALWPDFSFRFRGETRHFDPSEYTLEAA